MPADCPPTANIRRAAICKSPAGIQNRNTAAHPAQTNLPSVCISRCSVRSLADQSQEKPYIQPSITPPFNVGIGSLYPIRKKDYIVFRVPCQFICISAKRPFCRKICTWYHIRIITTLFVLWKTSKPVAATFAEYTKFYSSHVEKCHIKCYDKSKVRNAHDLYRRSFT